MNSERQLARAVVESITYFTGERPRRTKSIVPQMLGWLAGSLFFIFVFTAIGKLL